MLRSIYIKKNYIVIYKVYNWILLDNYIIKIFNNHGNILFIIVVTALKYGEQIRLETLVVHTLNYDFEKNS